LFSTEERNLYRFGTI